MAGFSRIFLFGEPGGFMGADGVNPIHFMVLVGDADRQWLESHYVDSSIKPIGSINRLIPAAPDHPDSLIDACIAFCPRYFRSCPTLAEVEYFLHDSKMLDFHLDDSSIPAAWARLRKEARGVFARLHIWDGNLVHVSPEKAT